MWNVEEECRGELHRTPRYSGGSLPEELNPIQAKLWMTNKEYKRSTCGGEASGNKYMQNGETGLL